MTTEVALPLNAVAREAPTGARAPLQRGRNRCPKLGARADVEKVLLHPFISAVSSQTS